MSLTPGLYAPYEVLSAGTFKMRPGGCGHLPSRAYQAMGPDDSIVTLLEDDRPKVSFAPLRRNLILHGGRLECVPHRLRGNEATFSTGGLDYYAFVVRGKKAPIEPARSVIQSLRVRKVEARSQPERRPTSSCFTAQQLLMLAGEAVTYVRDQAEAGRLTPAQKRSLGPIARGTFVPNMQNLISRLRSIAGRRGDAFSVAADAAQDGLYALERDPSIVSSPSRLAKAFEGARNAADVPGLSVGRC